MVKSIIVYIFSVFIHSEHFLAIHNVSSHSTSCCYVVLYDKWKIYQIAKFSSDGLILSHYWQPYCGHSFLKGDISLLKRTCKRKNLLWACFVLEIENPKLSYLIHWRNQFGLLFFKIVSFIIVQLLIW